MRIPIHREGWPFIALFAVVNAVAFWLWLWAGVVLLPVTIWCVAFFRDPERTPPPGENLLISPADGKLLPTIEAVPPAELGLGPQPRRRLSIFMDVFSVHVNRMPLSGRVIALAYRSGKFINASFDKASEHNERMGARVRWMNSSNPDDDIA
ncbi:MAG: phosphatidylserine decarboxylase, partial [Alphaproteobacteria bacterium]|nr:phosphatidylserine decarboxylase [Alphaproteobacteria bacterium]